MTPEDGFTVELARGRSRRILQGAGAQVFGLVVRVGLQLGQVFFLLRLWSPQAFGDWIALSTLPNYLGLSGLGFGNAAGNAVAVLAAEGRPEAIRAVLRAALAITAAGCVLGACAILGLASAIDFGPALQLRDIDRASLFLTLLLWCAVVTSRMLFGLAETVMRTDGRYPSYVVAESLAQTAEFVGLVAFVCLFRTAVAAATGILLGRLAVAVVVGIGLRRRYAWLGGRAEPLWPWFLRLIKPSMAFLLIPISQSLSLQGGVLIASHFFGPLAVASLATARTLGRLVETLLNMINNVVYEEVGYARGARDLMALRSLLIYSSALSILAAGAAAALLLSCGPWIYSVWTHGKLTLNYSVLLVVMGAGVIKALTSSSAAVLTGLNRHGFYSVILFVATVASMAVAVAFHSLGLTAVAASPLVAEGLVALYLFPAALRGAELTRAKLVKSVKLSFRDARKEAAALLDRRSSSGLLPQGRRAASDSSKGPERA